MAQSALIGQPAATQEDYWIAKGLLQAIGMFGADPWKGVPLPPHKPPPGKYRAESRASTNITAYSISIAIIIIITMTRLYLRAFSKRMRWGLDDWLMIVAFAFALAWPTLGICAVIYGGSGHHMYDVTYHEYRMFKAIGATQSTMFYEAVAWIKMSIIAFNMRLTGLTSRRWMIVHWTFFAFMAVFALLAPLLDIFITAPPRARFDLVYAGKMHAAPRMTFNPFIAANLLISIHITSDVLLLSFFGIVPWKLKMSRAVKFRLLMVFAVGAISFIAAVQWQLAQKSFGADVLWNLSNQISWTLVDLTAGMIVASLPILSSLFVMAFNSLKVSLRSYTRSSRSAGNSVGHQDRFAKSSSNKHGRWHGQSLLAPTTHANDSQQDASVTESSIYAETPGWEKPLGHVEEKEEWTTRTTVRHHQEGYQVSSESAGRNV